MYAEFKQVKVKQTQLLTNPVSAEQHVSTMIEQTREIKEREILKKAVEEKEMIEAEKRKAQKEREEKMCALMEEYRLHDAAIKTKQRQEEKDVRVWEMMQRFKRDEYDKQTNLEERKQQWQQKLEYGNELRKDIVRTDFFNESYNNRIWTFFKNNFFLCNFHLQQLFLYICACYIFET